jgi:hypothetical protein
LKQVRVASHHRPPWPILRTGFYIIILNFCQS